MGCVADGMCTIEGITVTAPPPTHQQEKQVQCGAEDPSCSGTGGGTWFNSGGEFAGGGDNGGWTSDGDTDGDGDYVDEGPIAFAICVAAALGPEGWLVLGLTAYTAWELWGARVDAEKAYARWQDYQKTSNWDLDEDEMYRSLWENARSAEKTLWGQLAFTSGASVAAIAKAVGACVAAGAAPTA